MSGKGFASLSPEERKKMASMGGKALKPEQRSFSKNNALAVSAGRKGGMSVPPAKRSFSKDRALAAASGAKGGRSVPPEKRTFSTNPDLAAEAGAKGGSAPRTPPAEEKPE